MISKGGTLVNDVKIQHSELRDKDVIQVGHYKIDCSFVTDKQTSNVASIRPVNAERPRDETESEAGEETEHPDDVVPRIVSTGPDIDKPFDSTYPSGGEDPNPRQVTENEVQPCVSTSVIENPSFSDRAQQYTSPPSGPVPPLHGTGVDVLVGPAQGKRIYFTRDSAALGVKDVTAVVIRSVEDGYTAQAPNETLPVTLNGDAIDDSPVQLDEGDLIAFSNLSARFFVDTSAE